MTKGAYINDTVILRAMQIIQQGYQDGKKILAIRLNDQAARLESNVYDHRNIPGLLIGLVLEDGASKLEKKNLRRLLNRKLDIWCEIGGFVTSVAISAAEVEFYPLRGDDADATFDLIITKLTTRFKINQVELQPKSKKLKATLAVQVRESDGYWSK